MKKALFGCIAALAFFEPACRQADEMTEEHSKTFLKLYGDVKTHADAFILKKDGGFYIIGTQKSDKDGTKMVLVETDPYGNPGILKTVQTGFDSHTGKSFLIDAAGNFVFLGEYQHPKNKKLVFAYQTTIDTAKLWLYGKQPEDLVPKYNEYPVALAESPDGSGFVVLADTDESPDADKASNLLLYKTDKNGKLLWRRLIGFDKLNGGGINDKGFGLYQSPTGEISVFINTEIDRKSYMALIVTNALGDITAAYRYDSYEVKDGKKTTNTLSATGTKVSKANDGFIICGTQGSGKAVVVKKIDHKGKDLWECVIDINPDGDQSQADFGVAAIQTSDGGYAVCGTAYHEVEKANSNANPKEKESFNNQIFFTKLDAKGILKESTVNFFGGLGQDQSSDLIQTPDGGFAVLGTVSIENQDMMTIIKLDPEGNLGLK